ncbi:trigger factor [Roseomonas sp. BN140053]|uniref:trigger factor n=1 Tax=Roseomonas sp. BN140053 TaxID=3391898 RepID=UPI0039ED06D4
MTPTRATILPLPPNGLERSFVLLIPAPVLAAAAERQLQRLRGNLPAGAPPEDPAALAARFGHGVRDAAARAMALDAAQQVIRTQKLRPAEPPRLEFLPPGPEDEVRARFSFDLLPEVPLPALDGLAPALAAAAAAAGQGMAEALDAALLPLRRAFAPERVLPPDHAAAPGDAALLEVSAVRLLRPENLLRNPDGEGAIAARNQVPARWALAWRKEGLARVAGSGVEGGLPCVDFRFEGRVSPQVSPQLALERAGEVPAQPGDRLRFEGYWSLPAGQLPEGMRASVVLEQRGADGTLLDRLAAMLPNPGPGALLAQPFAAQFTVAAPGTTGVHPVLRLRPRDEGEVAFTLRLGGARLSHAGDTAEGEPDPALRRGRVLARLGEPEASPDLPPGLLERLEGLRVGAVLVHDTVLPPVPGQPRGEARVRAVLRQLRQPGPADDALARRLGHPDLAALRRGLSAQLRDAQADRLRAALVEELLQRAGPFAVPQVLVDAAHAPLRAALDARLAAGRLLPEERNSSPEALHAALPARAERAVRADLLLAALRQPGDAEPSAAETAPERRHAALLDRLLAENGVALPGMEQD